MDGLCLLELSPDNALSQEKRLGAIAWGLLGPAVLAGERRTRTLGLGATVRSFNDLAVPGLGGVWFGKQLLLSTLGVAIAERVRNSGKRAQNIEATNAVEALACWLALNFSERKPDPRLRGSSKLDGKKDLLFAKVRKRDFYVTQPMRQATVQPLRALGMVESEGNRFNAFRCTPDGEAFIDAACADFKPFKRSVLSHLDKWARAEPVKVDRNEELRKALSPLEPMSAGAREFLRERIVQGTGTEPSRRRKVLEWVEALRDQKQQVKWPPKPTIIDELHWRDLLAGALFFKTRDAAISLLDKIEAHIGNTADQRLSINAKLPDSVVTKIESLQEHARLFLDEEYDPSPEGEATKFCHECTEQVHARLLESLLRREGRVLRQCGSDILPGVAFRGIDVSQSAARSPEDDGAEDEVARVIPMPDGISHRVRNLYLLNLDLRGELGRWLAGPADNHE